MLKIHKFDKNFSKLFKQEKKKLLKILNNDCQIEHIGSTAIEGVDGKGIIDIIIAFENKNKIEKAINLLQENGYFLVSDEKDRKGRVLITSVETGKESGLRDKHIHLVTKNNENFLKVILFRDYLRNNSNAKNEYVKLKYELLKKTNGNRKEYTKLKGDFIEKIILLARQDLV